MLRSIHSGLSEQEGSVSGPISLLCLLLSSDGELILTPYSNIGHSSFILSLIISCLSIWTQTEKSLSSLLGAVDPRRRKHMTHEEPSILRLVQFFFLGKYWQSLSLLPISLRRSLAWRVRLSEMGQRKTRQMKWKSCPNHKSMFFHQNYQEM